MTQRKAVLVADDCETSVLFERLLLNRDAYEVLVASDGEEALAKAVARRPDLIVLDVDMPKMSGIEVLRRLREHAATSRTPVLMVSVLGDLDNVQAAFLEGCNDYMPKPVDAVEFLARVRQHVSAEGGSQRSP
jgi:DNA-binding response OmpR family regulator